MEINSAFSSGVLGFNRASQQISESSERIANQSLPMDSGSAVLSDELTESITTEIINMKLAEVQAKASAKVISTADDMVGSLIDVTV